MVVLKASLADKETSTNYAPLIIKGFCVGKLKFHWNGLEFVPRSRFSAESVQVFPKSTSKDEIRLWVVKGFWK